MIFVEPPQVGGFFLRVKVEGHTFCKGMSLGV